MKYFDAFSGIGGFHLGIQQVHPDWINIGHAEIDKYAEAIYQYNFKGATNYGDITRIVPEQLPDFDMFCGGFPCQAFSIAGHRKGFEDTRGTLFYEIARIVSVKRPKLLFLENVKGLLSHDKGKTFGVILETFSKLGYICEWELLNSKYFGVPQNRERVFIIGYFRENGRPEIFPIGSNNAEINELQGPTVNTIKSRYNVQAEGSYIIESEQQTQNKIDIAINGSQAMRVYNPTLAPTLKALGGGCGAKTGLFLMPDDKSKNNTNDTKPQMGELRYDEGLRIKKGNICQLLRSNPGSGKPIVIEPSKHDVRSVLTPNRLTKRQNGRRMKGKDELSFTLTGQDIHGVCIGTTTEAVGTRQGSSTEYINSVNTIQKVTGQIRRLTPVECERLQGFPDNWTKYGIMNDKQVTISDGQRYKCCGNAVTVNVIKNIVKLF